VNFRFPVFLDVGGKKCVVTGEGFEVPQKVEALVKASASVTYINPSAHERISALVEQGMMQWERRAFSASDIDDCFLVICDTGNNEEIFRLAEERRVLCNSVDDPANCRFSFGSVHRQGELTIAISTNGWAPAVAVRLRQWLEREIGPEYATLLDILKEARPTITRGIADFAVRKALWYELVDSEVLQLLRDGDAEQAKRFVATRIESAIRQA
jgi:siroheme synthase-like protein